MLWRDSVEGGIEDAYHDRFRLAGQAKAVEAKLFGLAACDLRQNRVGALPQRRIVPRSANGEPAEAGRVQALSGQQWQKVAQAGSGEAVVGVRRITQEGKVVGLAVSDEIRFRDAEKGPCQSDRR